MHFSIIRALVLKVQTKLRASKDCDLGLLLPTTGSSFPGGSSARFLRDESKHHCGVPHPDALNTLTFSQTAANEHASVVIDDAVSSFQCLLPGTNPFCGPPRARIQRATLAKARAQQ
jgi:hypothetical protein